VACFVPECTTNGLSVIATPLDEPSTLAGIFICRDFKSPLPDGVLDDVPQFGPIAGALQTVDEAYESTIPPLAVRVTKMGQWLYPCNDGPARSLGP
jgi:hypothetical protein